MNYKNIPSPSYVLEETLLKQNLDLMKKVQDEAGVDIILAFKGFAMWSAFPLVRKYLKGATASSLHEAQLCVEEMKSKAHVYSPVYIPEEFESLLPLTEHLVFNSLSQYNLFYSKVADSPFDISCGLRVNPEYSDVNNDLYNPCVSGSRLGIKAELLKGGLPEGIEGLHFHVLCESDSFSLEKVLINFEKLFGHHLSKLKWLNMGGGHLMTSKDYDVEHLIQLLKNFKSKYPNLQIILEPGSAVAWETGFLKSTVLDIVEADGIKTALLDVSFTAHMPDTLEMPYKPTIIGACSEPSEKTIEEYPFKYRLGGISCLSGDFMEEYGFKNELVVGDEIILQDMIHYTMVKTTTFNGVKLPNIGILGEDGKFNLIKEFGYPDFKNRLS